MAHLDVISLTKEAELAQFVGKLLTDNGFDTVPLGEKSWTRDPFTGKIEGDRIYGRGSSDMKSGVDRQSDTWPKSLPYVTDGSILQPFYGGIPTIILGPGEPGMAHQTDEYCSVKRIKQSVLIYKNIILNRRK